ncbi:MAG: hypothetical protein R3Y06_01355 [Faecalibacterium sp.]
MKKILFKLTLLALPLLAYLAFFITFEPNNYFGLKESSASTAPIARIKEYVSEPGDHLIVGDSRFAHFDMELVNATSGETWQNLAFGGASLRESIDLANYILDSGNETEEILLGISFYTLNAGYDKDRMSTLEETLTNPLAYMFNLEYNINTLTTFTDFLAGREDSEETGDWVAEDYIAADGSVSELHQVLAVYPATIYPVCEGWALDTTQLARLEALAARCAAEGVALTIVFAPMADNVLTEVCEPLGIDTEMYALLPDLYGWEETYGITLLDYEWTNRPDFEDDTQFYDGFHLDTRYGLPQWTEQLFGAVALIS